MPPKRIYIDPGAVLKLLPAVARHPWIGAKLVKLQAEKAFFNLIYPGYRDGRAHKIRQVSIRITDQCNLRCRTCGQWGERGFLHGKNLKHLRLREVQPSRYLALFEDLKSRGHHPMVYLWGGEPMLYDGVREVITGATSLGFPVSIATNGTHLADMAETFTGAPLFLLQVSIDGHRAELHNRLRPAAGGGDSFARIRRGLAVVNERRRQMRSGLPLVASLTVISRENVGHLADIYETFRNEVDLFVFYLGWWIDAETAEMHEQDFKRRFGKVPTRHRGWIGGWRPDDYGGLDRQLKLLKHRSQSLSAPPITVIPPIMGKGNLSTYYSDHGVRFGYDQCISIFQAVEINSNGNLSPCRDYHDFVVGNVREATITQLWNSEAYKTFRRSLCKEGLMPVCSRCCGLMGY